MELSDGQVSAAVRINGELRSITTDLPADALFPIYSITKTLTAICALRLVEIGLLSIDASVGRWLPDVNVPTTITARHLLRHTSGLREYGPLPEYHHAVRTHPDQPWNSFSMRCCREGCSLHREKLVRASAGRLDG